MSEIQLHLISVKQLQSVVNMELQSVINIVINMQLVFAGQFFQNTNWIMTSVVLAWVTVTIGYIIVRATQSFDFKKNKAGLLPYGIIVLTVEVRSRCSYYLPKQQHI